MSQQVSPNLSRRAFLLRSEMPAPRVTLTDRCFATSGVYCESCRDVCETGALRFVPQLGSVPTPIVDADLCTQCGECAWVCPRDALQVRPLEKSDG
ncbi:MAG: 4Fe-4S binding protein [Betaproteobacteria bacterium]